LRRNINLKNPSWRPCGLTRGKLALKEIKARVVVDKVKAEAIGEDA
jgi:hypothetical protein